MGEGEVVELTVRKVS